MAFIPTEAHMRPPLTERGINGEDRNFTTLNNELTGRSESLLKSWYPEGKKSGREFRIGNIDGLPGNSLAINLDSGLWCDHANPSDKGDLITLYAKKNRISKGNAFKELSNSSTISRKPRQAKSKPKAEGDEWEHARTKPDTGVPSSRKPSFKYRYRDADGNPVGVVQRFDQADGKKSFSQWSWMRHRQTGECKWINKGFQKPRPLYRGEDLAEHPDKPVLIVEGEKCADAAREVLTDFVVVTWSQGSNSVDCSDWTQLIDRNVTIWPDNDDQGHDAATAIKKHLPQAKVVKVPSGKPKKWDLADAIAEAWTRDGILDEINKTEPSELFQKLKLATISNQDRIAQMNKKRVDSVEVIAGMALLGEATVIYMQANGGKTLITFSALIDSIRAGRIDGSKVYYILADDTFNGSIEKGELAEREGFNLVVPDSTDGALSLNDISPLMVELARTGQASGVVLIVDTLKKIVSMMQKAAAADFGKICRSFVQSGGTFIALGHVNKHTGDDGKAVHEGTGDIVNDFDCSFTGSIDTPKDEPNRQVTFENKKLRGPVKSKVSLSYDSRSETPWLDKLKSVSFRSPEEASKIKQLNEYHAQLDEDLDIACWIYDFLADGAKLTTAIKKGGCPHGGEGKIDKTLKRYGNTHPRLEFRFWNCSVGDKNAHLYSRTINKPKAISEAWRPGAK